MNQKQIPLLIFSLVLLLSSMIPETSSAQHIIGQETVDKVTQRVDNAEKKRVTSFMVDRDDLKPGGLYLFRLSVRGDYKPELQVSFDKATYEEGDEITMTIERKTANRRIVTHPRTREEIDEGIAWEKLPVWGSVIRHAEIKGATPDENGTIWLEEGESFTAKNVWEKGRTSDTFRITMAAGNVNFGESRSYVLVKKQQNESEKDQRKKDPLDNDVSQMMQSSIPSSLSIGCFSSIDKPSGGTNAPGVFSAMDGGETSMRLKNETLNTSEYKPVETEEMEAASFTVNGGAFLYEDEEFTSTNKPVEHAVLTVFESDNQSKLNDINALADEDDFDIIRNHYPISTNFNGQYSINISTSRNYFRIGISIARIEGFQDVYQTYRIVDDANMQRCHLLTDTNSTAISSYTIDPITLEQTSSDPEAETMRVSAYIAERLNEALSMNVGQDLKTLQTIYIATKEEDEAFERRSFASVYDSNEKISFVQVGTDPDFDLQDAVLLHEVGHTLLYAADPNFQRSSEAGGYHYLNNLSHPHVAYSEGWASFFAAAVTGDPALY